MVGFLQVASRLTDFLQLLGILNEPCGQPRPCGLQQMLYLAMVCNQWGKHLSHCHRDDTA